MRITLFGLLAMAGVGVAAVAPSDSSPSTSASAATVTALQQEMRLLHSAMQVALTAVSNNELDAITPAIHQVHEAKEVTEKALQRGDIKLPRNGDKLKEFTKEDEAFHGELVKLVKAARAHDLNATTRQLGSVLNGCTACHAKFRFPAPTPTR